MFGTLAHAVLAQGDSRLGTGVPLVGRERELAVLRDAVDRLRRREPQLPIEIVGPAGIGKSALLNEVRAGAARFGAEILEGRGSQFEQALPYAAAIAALDGHPHELDSVEPALRHAAHDHVRRLLQDLGRDQRTLVLLDDLHWADAATKDLVAALLERPPRAPVLLVVAYRPQHAGGDVPAAIGSAAARGAIRRLQLEPLARADAAELIGAAANRTDAAALHELCGGNPFLLTECVRAMGDGTWRPPAKLRPEQAASAVPPLITDHLASELSPLPQSARTLLDSAAILGDPCDIDLAAQVAELDERSAAAAIDRLVASDLLRPSADARRFRFRHPLIREAVHQATPPGWRRLAHARTAHLLQAAGAPGTAVAHHVANSAQVGDLDAVALLTEAGRATLARSPATAADWLSTAWRLLPDSERGALAQQNLLYALCVALSVRARGAEALEILAQAMETVEAGSQEAERLMLGAAIVKATGGDYDAACDDLTLLLSQRSGGPSLESAQSYRALAVAQQLVGRLDEARAAAHTALEHARALGIPFADLACLPTVAWLEYLAGEVGASRTMAEQAQRAFESLDSAALPWLVDALVTHLQLATVLELDGVDALLERAAITTSDGLRPILAVEVLALRARRALRAGRIRDAVVLSRAADEEAELLNEPASLMQSRLAAAWVANEARTPEEAIEAGERALDAARRYGGPTAIAAATAALAASHVAAGSVQRALHVLRANPFEPAAAPEQIGCGAAIEALALAEVMGDAPAPLSLTAVARERADGVPYACRRLELTAATIARATDPAIADEHLRRAEAAVADSVLDRWEAEILRAELQAETGSDPGVHDSLGAIARAADDAGAVRIAALARRTLRGLSEPAARTSQAASEPLTRQQQAVAQRAAAGATNAEIAAELHLSIKTVEAHLRGAYVKLGVRSRRALAGLEL